MSHHFEVLTVPAPTQGSFAIGPPLQLTSFSRDAAGDIAFDDSSLRYFRVPSLGADLSQGYEAFHARNRAHRYVGHPRRLDEILEACLLDDDARPHVGEAHVVTWRGILTKIVLRTKLQLNVSYVNGTLFLEEHDFKPWVRGQQLAKESYPGYSSEALCTAASPDATDDSETVDLSMWSSVATRNLGDLKVVFAGGVDCVKGGYQGQHDTFLEVKTRNGALHNALLKKWYMQSFLLGVPEIFVGYRNNNQILTRTESMVVSDMPFARLSGWNVDKDIAHAICGGQLDGGASEDTVWRVELNSGGIQIRSASTDEMKDVDSKAGRQRRVGILPARLVQQLKALEV